MLEIINTFTINQAISHANLPIWLLPASVSLLMGLTKLLAWCISYDTTSIVILGSKGAGKTTLWNQLRDLEIKGTYLPTSESDIESFCVKSGDKTMQILATKDIGGGDDWIHWYESLIQEDGTFVFYLIDLTTLTRFREETRARLQKISKIICDKRLKNCGCRILATHKDIYEKGGIGKNGESAKTYVNRILDIKSIKNIKIKIEESVMPINLLDKNDINKIKNEITRS